ncbi:MAG TPA: hypothetical protein VKD71_10640 [Gemmataceae bacterium]|nr:hypothetical protein [Gemmataceae bacterium]
MFRKRRSWFVLGIALAALAAVGLAVWFSLRGRSYEATPLTFDGTSDQLRQTVIVPTLDSPIPDGKSAIWCASFQLAWNRLRDDVAKGPIQLANAQAIADRLNRGDQSEDDLEPGSVYAAAGLMRDGVVDRIRDQMAARFPNVPAPQFDVPPEGAVAYSYLEASAKFDIPFFDNDEPFEFTDSNGKKALVGSFGVRKKDDYAYRELRDQVQILYRGADPHGSKSPEIPEFIVDPCKSSNPYQIVLARVERKATLARTLADIETKNASVQLDPYVATLNPVDTLLVPNMAWQLTRHFVELEGKDKQLLNPGLQGLYSAVAMQTIRFRLDRSGAELRSEFKHEVKPSATFFNFNRPFLIVMKKRNSKQPFFVMWVDNAELLQRK